MSLLLWTALILGLSGSLHCVGMCGPIALALPLSAKQRFEVWKQVAIYHSGRIMTYSLMGLFFGLFGQGVFLIGWQKWFAIGLGVVILFGALFSWSIEHQVIKIPMIARMLEKVKQHLGRNLRMNTVGATLRVGMLNGLLPCGLVYVALFGAVSTGDVLQGGLYMVMFGLGTTPLIFALMLMGKQLPLQFKNLLRMLSPVVLVVVALLLIYRGCLLDVPADLNFWEATNFQPMCH